MNTRSAKIRSTTSVLLAAIMLITSVPQTGISVRAAALANTANITSPQSESAAEDSTTEETASWDGLEPETGMPVYTDTFQTKAASYVVDDPRGYILTDVIMSPTSYSAHFSAMSNKAPIDNLKVLYTTDPTLAENFFPGVSHISASEADSKGYLTSSFTNLAWQAKQDDAGSAYYTADFAGISSHLLPNTTYYYRIISALYTATSTGVSSDYYFLTVPGEFTTTAPIQTSSVRITSLEAEAIGYNHAKIVWTVDNPNQEYIPRQFLRDTTRNLRYSATAYTDQNGNIVPEKYYVSMPTAGMTITVCPQIEVYTSESTLMTINSTESLTVESADINQAQITVTAESNYTTLAFQLNITPWPYDNDFLFGKLFYRIANETEWSSSRFTIQSSQTPAVISGLSSATNYEYYIQLFDSATATQCLWSLGNATQPFSISTKVPEQYEDSAFPDPAFRNYLKAQTNTPEGELLTGDKLSSITSLTWIRKSGEDTIYGLEGIQYLENLQKIIIDNHGITNADGISGLAKLTYVSLSHNELTSLPDLSGLPMLETAYFSYNKIASGVTADKLPAAFLAANPSWLSNTSCWQRLPAETPTQADINRMTSELPYDIDLPNTYAIAPSTHSPYAAGRLSNDSLTNSLNLMNFCRYVAGIPADVTLNESYLEYAQAGALVNCVNNKLTHYPTQPEGFPDDLYKLGQGGCGRSNLAMGYTPLGHSIVNGWLHDGDSSNIDRVGHRRWVLNPTMSATGFGAVGSYSAMYSFDRQRARTISDFVAWPARNMPLELITDSGYPWSISLGSDYQIADTSAVRVTLRDTTSGKTWNFSEKTSSFNANYFSINSAGYGSGTCIIFRPKTSEVSYTNGSQFEVTVSGLEDRFEKATTIKYTVKMFSLDKTSSSIRLNQKSLKLCPGQTAILKATVTPEATADTPIVWSSSNPDVATVDENGKVTAIAPGDAVVTASYNGKRATCNVTVRDYSIDRTELRFDLAQGTQTETLTVSDGVNTVTDVTWSSTDEGVATVSKKNGLGIVTPTGAGTAQIQAEIKNGPVFTCTVTVTKDILAAISLNTQECSLEKGASRQLKVYFVPHDTTLSKEITWSSDTPDVASVDTSGTVTALSRGAAIITASVNTNTGVLTARCTVTVTETAEPAQDNIPSGLQALTNVQTRLSNVSLKDYEGWEWENGDIALAQFAGMQEKSFAAVYHKEGYADYKTTLTVSLATLTGLSITADKTALGTNETTAADIQWKLSGSQTVLSGYAEALQWSSSNPSVLEVTSAVPDKNTQTQVILKAGTTAGKSTVTAQITLGGKTYTARHAFTVVNGNIAVFENIAADGFEPVKRDGIDLTCYQGKLETQTGSLLATVSNTTKLTVKSNNTKVVSVGKIQSENGSFRIPLTMKAAGTAKLTLTANDAAKTKTEVLLYIKDPRPNLGENTVTVNKLKTSGSTLFIYPNDGYTITGCELTGAYATLFETLTPGTDPDSYLLKAKTDTEKGSYKLTVKVTTEDNASAVAESDSTIGSYELPLTVKVTEQAPKYKIKQSAKANLFYQDLGAPQITITTEETLTNLTLIGCDFQLAESDADTPDSYTIVPNIAGTLTPYCTTQGNLMVTFEGYETILMPFTVGIEIKKPKLTLDSKNVTLYPNAGVTTARLQVKSGKQTLALDAVTAALQNAEGCTLTRTDKELTVSADGLNTETLSKVTTLKTSITLKHDDWAETISLPLTLKINPGKPAIKLQKSSLQLNADASAMAYDMAETEILWKDGAWFDPDTDISVSAANAKSQAVIHEGIVFEQDGNKVLARLNNQSIAAGSYKFKVHVVGMPGTSASLTVKVVNTDLKKAVKLSAKGSIDVLNRSGSFVTVTPSLKALNGNITNVTLSGDFAHLFQAELDKNNKILIRARETDSNGKDLALITKYNYPVKLILTLQNAEGETLRYTTSELKIKLKQSKPKVTATPKNPVFYSGAYNNVRLTINATLKGADNPDITDIELINQTDLFDYSNGVLTLRNAGAAVKGKTYSLQFRITFKGQADNEKATMIKVNAKIK